MNDFVQTLLRIVGHFIGKDINNEYKTQGKIFFFFAPCSKYLLTMGTDVEAVKTEIIDVLDILDEELSIEEFRFLPTPKCIITIPPSHISFRDFNELIGWLTDDVNTVGLVESKDLTYTVYEDESTTNLIGQTEQGEKFFISSIDKYGQKQFLRLNNEIELLEDYSVSRIKNDLRARIT